MMKQMMFLLVLISSALAFSFNAPIGSQIGYFGTCSDDFYTTFIADLGGYIGAAIGLIIVLISLAFMIGSVTSNANFTIFAKDELFHLVVSVIILIAIGSTFYFTCVTTSGFLGATLENVGEKGPSKCFSGTEPPQVVAKCYAADMASVARNALKGAVSNNIRQEMDSSFTIGIFNPFNGGMVTPLGAYKRTYAAQLDMIANTFIMPALISITVQKIFLDFSSDIVAFLVPFAIFLRFLPPTRQLGNIFLALALGIYVIIPTIYAVNGAMDKVVFGSCSDLNLVKTGITVSVTDDQVMGSCDSPYGFWTIARLIPYAYFLPNFTLAVFITFMSAINKALKVIT